MKGRRAHGSGTLGKGRPRKLRARGTPEWLSTGAELDAMARRRCLMVLSVLSGEKSVTESIEEQEISRGLYYQLEDRALRGMLEALMPGSESGTATGPGQRVAGLEAHVKRLEQGKRRLERLLLWTRRVVKKGPVKQRLGRPRGKRGLHSSRSGANSLSASREPKPSSSIPASLMTATTPKDGVGES